MNAASAVVSWLLLALTGWSLGSPTVRPSPVS